MCRPASNHGRVTQIQLASARCSILLFAYSSPLLAGPLCPFLSSSIPLFLSSSLLCSSLLHHFVATFLPEAATLSPQAWGHFRVIFPPRLCPLKEPVIHRTPFFLLIDHKRAHAACLLPPRCLLMSAIVGFYTSQSFYLCGPTNSDIYPSLAAPVASLTNTGRVIITT